MTQPEEGVKNQICALIASQGPMTISQFISLCLSDGKAGYYHHVMPFGRKGDFITAPEISQMFGEMLGLWAVAAWQSIGLPAEFVFCEVGSGRGTLMDDMLRTIRKLKPEFLDHAQIILIETSRQLRRLAAEKLASHVLSLGQEIKFVDLWQELPPLPLIMLGNEWLDCLPIHQYVRTNSGWYERMVSLDGENNLCFALGLTPVDEAILPAPAMSAPIGTIVEVSPAREAAIDHIGHHIMAANGAGLLIDYGSLETGLGDTLQAVSHHEYQHPLHAPGLHDLTSHVDFAALGRTARSSGCIHAGMTQGVFLEQMGIWQRARRLCAGRDPAFEQQTMGQVERLTSDQEMGQLFKVFCLSRPGSFLFPFRDWQQ